MAVPSTDVGSSSAHGELGLQGFDGTKFHLSLEFKYMGIQLGTRHFASKPPVIRFFSHPFYPFGSYGDPYLFDLSTS